MESPIVFLKKILGIYKGESELIFTAAGVWDVHYNGSTYNEYCHFDIYYNSYTKKYTLKVRGYKPDSHDLYHKIFKYMRMLNEGDAYIKGGEIYTYSSKSNSETNGKDINTMNETECNVYLNKALEEENYELAEKLKKRLEDFNS